MQEYAVQMRSDLWSGLRTIFDGVSRGNDEISVPQIEHVVRNIMGETDKSELDYIFKNMFRIDTDNSGSVSFSQFANFFLKRHCGEIALQRAHKKSLIGKGSERKLNLHQFLALLNDAYSFLHVTTDETNATEIFRKFDTDRDNYITYVQYFQFIQKYICKDKQTLKAEAERRPPPPIVVEYVKPAAPVITTKVYSSRLRFFIWECLKRLYNAFDFNKDGKLQIEEIKTLIADILKLKNRKDIDYVLFTIFNLGSGGEIVFEEFCPFFVQHVGELGLSQLVSLNPGMRRVLNRDQFVELFKSSFVFLSTSRIKDELLWRFFTFIDTDRDGLISFEQYITWLKSFLCPSNYRGDSYYFDLDDMGLDAGAHMIMDELKSVIVKESRIIRESYDFSKYNFSNIELGQTIRSNLLTLLIEFDKNRNKLFQENEIIDILVTLLHQNEMEIPYVIRNVFRYDRDNDKCITFSEMANFLLEMHCGEMAIQRLHKRQTYKRGAERMMSVDEFVITLNDALGYLRAFASEKDLKQLFSEVDVDHDGYITYKEYFEFLTYYFGSGSLAALQELVVKTHITLSIEEEFGRWLQFEASKALKAYVQPKMRMDKNSLAIILKRVFRELDPEIEFVLTDLFKIIFDIYNYSSDEEIRRLLLLLHIGIVLLLRGHKGRKFVRWSDFMINQQEFVRLILEATEWVELPVDPKTLIQIFLKLDTNRDGYITYFEYFSFLRSCIGCSPNFQLDSFFNSLFSTKVAIERPTPAVSKIVTAPLTQRQQADEFQGRVWNELRQLFNFYLKNGATTLQRDDVKLLIGQVLKQLNQQEQDYVFWNYFRLDKDGDNEVTFQEFAPFILNHATEIALQRFHTKSTKGKSTLSVDEFIVLANSAFGFLKSINKEEEVLKVLYRLLDTDKSGDLGYNQYLMWSKGLVKKYK